MKTIHTLMPECKYCGSTSVHLGKTKAGKPMLFELRTPHFVFCSKKRGKQNSRRSNEDNEVFDMLTAQWDAKRAKHLLPLVKGNTLEDKLKSALNIVAKESE